MAQAKQPTADWFQAQILKSLQEVKDKVDESLLLGRQNGEDIRSLRKELGVDGLHGRIPQLEQAMARLDRQQEDDNKAVLGKIEELGKKQHDDKNKLIARIEPLEWKSQQIKGGSSIISRLIDILTSSLSAGIVVAIAKAMGWIH